MTSPFSVLATTTTAGAISNSSASSLNNPLAGSASQSSVAPAYGEAAAARRRIFSVVVGCILQEVGCVSVEKAVVGTLVEMLQSTIVELGRLSRGYCELAYRTEPLGADVILALSDMGLNYDGLHTYSRRAGRSLVPSPQVLQDTKHHTILQVGDKRPHLSYIPDNLPQFPDTHTYCFTPTVKQPVTEYEAIREKAATQKRDIERALTKFTTKTNPTENLFIAEDKEFALVCVAPTPCQNIDALMPRDQVFEAELDYEVSKARKKRQDRLTNFQQQQQQLRQEQGEEDPKQTSDPLDGDVTANPYLQAVKPPKDYTNTTASATATALAATNHHRHATHANNQHQHRDGILNGNDYFDKTINNADLGGGGGGGVESHHRYGDIGGTVDHAVGNPQYGSNQPDADSSHDVSGEDYSSFLGNNISRIVIGSAPVNNNGSNNNMGIADNEDTVPINSEMSNGNRYDSYDSENNPNDGEYRPENDLVDATYGGINDTSIDNAAADNESMNHRHQDYSDAMGDFEDNGEQQQLQEDGDGVHSYYGGDSSIIMDDISPRHNDSGDMS